jgi:hypothetical protein
MPYGPPPGGRPNPCGAPQSEPAGQFPPAPGQPGAYPPPPGQPFGPPPGTPIQGRKRRRWVWIVPLVVVVGLLVAGGITWLTSSPDNAAVGECLNVKQFKQGVEPTKVDCNDPSANVKIALRLDDNGTCPGNNYDEYSVSGHGSNYKLCLMLNAHDGDCFSNVTTSSTEGYKRVPCTDPTADVQILKVVNGTANESACQGLNDDGALTYPNPPTTLCAVKKNTST